MASPLAFLFTRLFQKYFISTQLLANSWQVLSSSGSNVGMLWLGSLPLFYHASYPMYDFFCILCSRKDLYTNLWRISLLLKPKTTLTLQIFLHKWWIQDQVFFLNNKNRYFYWEFVRLGEKLIIQTFSEVF